MMLRYPINLVPDDNGTLMVTCPLLPEVATFGEDEADAMRHAVSAIEEALASRIADGADVPAPNGKRGPVVLPLATAIKVELYRSLRHSGITRAELMRRLGWKRESVDRLFRLDHDSRLDRLEAAFRALHRSIDLEVRTDG